MRTRSRHLAVPDTHLRWPTEMNVSVSSRRAVRANEPLIPVGKQLLVSRRIYTVTCDSSETLLRRG